MSRGPHAVRLSLHDDPSIKPALDNGVCCTACLDRGIFVAFVALVISEARVNCTPTSASTRLGQYCTIASFMHSRQGSCRGQARVKLLKSGSQRSPVARGRAHAFDDHSTVTSTQATLSRNKLAALPITKIVPPYLSCVPTASLRVLEERKSRGRVLLQDQDGGPLSCNLLCSGVRAHKAFFVMIPYSTPPDAVHGVH